MMDPAKLKAAIEALKNNDGEAALAVLEEMLVAAAAGDAADEAAEQDPAVATEETPAVPPADPMKPKDPAAPPTEATALAMLQRITGTTNIVEAEARLTTVVRGYDATERSQRTIDLASRRDLIGKLVKLGAETPASAWTGEPAQRNPCKRLAAVSLEDMRAHVTALEAVKGGVQTRGQEPPVSADDSDAATPEESAAIKKLEISLPEYRARKASAVRTRSA